MPGSIDWNVWLRNPLPLEVLRFMVSAPRFGLPVLSHRLLVWFGALLSDIVLWALLFTAVTALLLWNFPDLAWWGYTRRIRMTIDDANALVKGSAVHLMGVTIGSVQKVTLLPDHQQVELKLSIQPDAPPIPPDAQATVVFSGLGGSKSVEFTVPEGTLLNTPGQLAAQRTDSMRWPRRFEVATPLRLQEVLDYQVETAKALEAGAVSLNAMFDDNPIAFLQAQAAQGLVSSQGAIAQSQQLATLAPQFEQQFTTMTGQIGEVMRRLDRESYALRRLTTSTDNQRRVRQGYRWLNTKIPQVQNRLDTTQEQLLRGTLPYQQGLQHMDDWQKRQQQTAWWQEVEEQLPEWELRLWQSRNTLQRWDERLCAGPLPDLACWDHRIKTFNQRLLELNRWIEDNPQAINAPTD